MSREHCELTASTAVARIVAVAIIAVFAATLSHVATAQPFPTRVVRIVVPYSPGGATDTLARALAQRLAEPWAHPVAVENRPGGNTVLGAQEVARATPDGHTLLLTAEATLVANPALYKSLPYDPIKSFAPITALVGVTQVLVAHPGFNAKTLDDLVRAAKARPGGIAYGSFGSGSTGHLNMVMLERRTGVELLHVPYKGAAPALTDVIGGQVPLLFASIGLVAANLRAGKLHAIGVGSAKRHPLFPDLPTLAESGLPGFEATSWFGLLAPAGTPAATITRINGDVQRIFADPAFAGKHVTGQALDSLVGPPEAFAAFIRTEMQTWGKVIRDGNVSLD